MHWRQRFPHPPIHYPAHLSAPTFPDEAGEARASCQFHQHDQAGLRVHLDSACGLWRCDGCGAHGDLITFHAGHTGLSFLAAVRDLLRWTP